MTKETASFIEKLAEKYLKRKKKNGAKKVEDGIVRRLAKNGLIDKDNYKVKAAGKNPRRRKRRRRRARPLHHPLTLTHSLLAQTPPATPTTPRAMARRINRRKRSLEKTTTTINLRPTLRAKLGKKIRYRSLHNQWRDLRRACSIWLQSLSFVS